MAGASGLYARLACMRELRSRSLDPRVCAASRVGIWHVKAGLSKMVEDMPAALHTGAVWSRLIAHDRVWCRFLPKCVSFLTNPIQVHSQPDCTFKCISITSTCITYMMHSKQVAFVHLHFRRQSAFVENVFILHSRRCI